MNYIVKETYTPIDNVILMEDMQAGQIGCIVEWQSNRTHDDYCYVVCGGDDGGEWGVIGLGHHRYWTQTDKTNGGAKAKVRLLRRGEEITLKGI